MPTGYKKDGSYSGKVFQKGQPAWNKNIPLTKKWKGNLSKSLKGKIPWIKGKKHTKETKRKLGKHNLRRYASGEKFGFQKGHGAFPNNHTSLGMHWKMKETAKKNLSDALKGKPKSEIHKKHLSEANTGKCGEEASNWQGGITPLNAQIRGSIETHLWRGAVFGRDGYTCQKCGNKSKLHPHHIKNFAQYPELRFAINNGITLCRECHIKFHKKYGYRNNTQKQLTEFLHGKP